jgi:hypothetical protein
MWNQSVSKILLITGLMTGLCGVGTAPAWATVDPIWSGSIREASRMAKAAKKGIEASKDDCNGLKKLKSLLELGADRPVKKLPGKLGEIRMQLSGLDLMASTMEFAANISRDPTTVGAATRVLGIRDDAFDFLDQKLAFCGNGVERDIER